MKAYYKSEDKNFTLLQGNCIELMSKFDFKFDMIFADPPYFLSNGGISVQSGKMVSVNKGDWDRSRGEDADHAFNREWLKACREKLKSNGTGRTTIYSLLPRILQGWATKYLIA